MCCRTENMAVHFPLHTRQSGDLLWVWKNQQWQYSQGSSTSQTCPTASACEIFINAGKLPTHSYTQKAGCDSEYKRKGWVEQAIKDNDAWIKLWQKHTNNWVANSSNDLRTKRPQWEGSSQWLKVASCLFIESSFEMSHLHTLQCSGLLWLSGWPCHPPALGTLHKTFVLPRLGTSRLDRRHTCHARCRSMFQRNNLLYEGNIGMWSKQKPIGRTLIKIVASNWAWELYIVFHLHQR